MSDLLLKWARISALGRIAALELKPRTGQPGMLRIIGPGCRASSQARPLIGPGSAHIYRKTGQF